MASHAKATVVALGAASALALAACSDGADAEPGLSPGGPTTGATSSASATSSGTSTTTTSPPATATVAIPAAARAHTEEGAKAFGRFYTLEMDRATVSADAAALKALSDPDCVACQGIIEVVEGYHSRGERQEKSSLVVDLVTLASYASEKAEVDVLAQDKAHRVISKEGQVVSTSKGAKINFRHALEWQPEGWRVVDSEIVQ